MEDKDFIAAGGYGRVRGIELFGFDLAKKMLNLLPLKTLVIDFSGPNINIKQLYTKASQHKAIVSEILHLK